MGSVKVSYGAEARIKIERHHRCLNCGNEFSYAMNRAIGGSSKHSTTGATKMAEQNLDFAVRGAVAVFPCPRCQFIQPEMVNEARDVLDGSSYWTYALSGFVWLIVSPFFPRFSLGIWAFSILMEYWQIWSTMLANPNSTGSWKLGANYPGNEGILAGNKPLGLILAFLSGLLLILVYRFLPASAKMSKYLDTPEFYTYIGLFLTSIVLLCVGIAVLIRASRVGSVKTVTILDDRTRVSPLANNELTSSDFGYDGL